MREPLSRTAALFFIVVSCVVALTPKDTAHLAAQLGSMRGKKWISPAEYRNLQTQYLAWIDTRMKAGDSTEGMNRELRAAGLFPHWLDTSDEMFDSHAGYLEELSTKPVRGAEDLIAIVAGIYKGSGCSLDVTAVLYNRKSFTRFGSIDVGEPEYAFYLSGLDAGEVTVTGHRVVASSWVASNCTSTWNGKRIRIDQVRESSVDNLLARNLFAQDRDEAENVAAWVQGDVVTFWYRGGLGDSQLLAGPSVARYRILGGHAVRESPIALTRAGFIHEWLTMTDADAVRWAESNAVEKRGTISAEINKYGFEWTHIAQCGGSPPLWEVGVSVYDLKTPYVFQILGSRATALRMIGVANTVTQSCTTEDIGRGLESVMLELPW